MSLTSSTFLLKTRELYYVNAISSPTQLDYRAVLTAPTALVVPLTITSTNKVLRISTDGVVLTNAILTEKTYSTVEEIRAEVQTKLAGTTYEVTLSESNQLVFRYPSERLFITSNAGGSTANVALGFGISGANTTANVNNFILVFVPGYTKSTFKVPPLLYTTNGELLSSLQSVLNGTSYSVAFQSNFTDRLLFSSDKFFFLDSVGGGSLVNVKLGFQSNYTDGVNAASYRSYTFPPVDFYAPSTISDTNVFMRLVNAEMSGFGISSSRIPYTISLLNVPQPVGTSTETGDRCTRSTLLGTVAGRGIEEKGCNILTHIPDGLQELTFRVDVLYQNDRTFYITDNQVYQFTIEFEVSTHK